MASSPFRRQDRSLKAIIPVVLVLHVFFILFLVQDSSDKKPIPKKTLVVKTVQLAPKKEVKVQKEEPKIAIADEIKPPIEEPLPKIEEKKEEPEPLPLPEKVEEKKPEVKKKEEPKAQEKVAKSSPPPPPPPKKKSPPQKKEVAKAPPPKKTPKPVAKAESKKKSEPTPKKVVKEAPKPKLEVAKIDDEKEKERARQKEAETKRKLELFARAKEKIGKIDTSQGKIASASTSDIITKATPSRIDSMQIDSLMIETENVLSTKETAYRDELAHRLKLLLKLPEYGEVKVKICVQRDGTMKSVTILNAKNRANREYLEKALPKIKVPPFGDNFQGLTEYTFQITMSNE